VDLAVCFLPSPANGTASQSSGHRASQEAVARVAVLVAAFCCCLQWCLLLVYCSAVYSGDRSSVRTAASTVPLTPTAATHKALLWLRQAGRHSQRSDLRPHCFMHWGKKVSARVLDREISKSRASEVANQWQRLERDSESLS
jgi:hypothetical protein